MSQCEETARMADTLAQKYRKAGDMDFANLLEKTSKSIRFIDKN